MLTESFSYRGALQEARAAAADAATLLLAECRRPGGPRGSHGKCPADDEAEERIRARLTDAFPGWGYLGEETGHLPQAASEPHVWLVDPNDGTSSMLQGYRGHAVSIALLRDGVPVLGVVRAVDAPDDDGDEFAWAEGCGPLLRNGSPLPPPAWPAASGALDVVHLSQGVDRHPLVNIPLVAPARFRHVASIAYRLALAAAGEGVAAVSLNGPGSWDYAGGHALLLAVGGILLDEQGAPVQYSRIGHSHTWHCFGGAPGVARALAAHDWSNVAGQGYGEATPLPGYAAMRLAPVELCHDSGRLRRAQGCLLGQVAGDSLGSLVEFQTPQEIEARYPGGPQLLENGGTWKTLAGQPTDDSELALMLARTLVRIGHFDAEAVASAYARWYHGWVQEQAVPGRVYDWSRPFDVGNTTATALGAVQAASIEQGGAAAAAEAHAIQASQANGALMRVSPLGIWGWNKDPAIVAEAARADARLTHPHPACQECSAIYVTAIAHAVATGANAQATYAFACAWAVEHCRVQMVRDWLLAAAAGPTDDFLTQQGWVRHAFPNAFFQLLHAPSLEAGVVATVRRGGDTDTNGAVAGALLGAVWGRARIPDQWRQMVLSCRPAPTYPLARQPRPALYWPVDVEQLAERLLAK
ncbi:MAG: inositol monophosphatase family protein [Chloroflexota bacterium]